MRRAYAITIIGNCLTRDALKTTATLAGHWFEPYFKRLDEVLRALLKNYSKWLDQAGFLAMSDIADNLLGQSDITSKPRPDDRLYIDIPFSAETMSV